jgi:hypothetical protein
MKNIYYSDGINTFGPYTFEQLKERGLTAETLVYFDEAIGWVEAASVPELRSLFHGSQPSQTIHMQASNTATKPMYSSQPKNYLVESILVTLFCCLPLGVIGIINASKVESLFKAGDVDGAVKYSEEAKKWSTIGFCVGVAFLVLYFLIFVGDV